MTLPLEKTDFKHVHRPIADDEKKVDIIQTTDEAEPKWTPAEEKKLRNKLDWHIVPIVCALYLMCFLDRANIGNARIQGMATDLKLVGYRFNWALTVFYLTYMAVEIPSQTALKYVGPRYWIPFLVFGFGFVSLCTAFVKNFDQLCVARAFLGVFEGGTQPGIAFFLSCFYKRQELLFRVGLFFASSSMAGAFGGLLATGLARVPRWGVESTPIHTWRNIFFFEGILTMLVAGIAVFYLPQTPESCTFLNPRERMIAAERLALEHKANPNEKVEPRHVKMAMLSVNNYICAFGYFLINISVQGISVFLPTILADLGWTATKAQLYSVPPYVLASATSILVAFVSDRTRMRGIYLAAFAILPTIGFALLRSSHSSSIKYMAVYFVSVGIFPGGPGFLSWGLNNAAGPAVRAVSGGYIVMIGTMGALVATWTYLVRDAPNYPIGHSINLGASVGVLVLASGGITFCVLENRARAKGKRDHVLNGLESEEEKRELGYKDPRFRFIA